jgi:hypothetical protein
MIAVHFSKDYAQAVLDAIQTGKPIPPPPGPGWTGNAMLTLAGILYAAVFSQGPHQHQLAGISQAQREAMPGERREAVEETFHRDVHDGIEFLSFVTFHLIGGEWEQRYSGPEVKAVVAETADGKKTVKPAKGFKGHKDLL